MGPIASLDIGTNSTRVLVARPVDGKLDILDRRNTITRLGQGIGANGRLAPEAVERTLDCLAGYRQILDRHGVERVRVATTSAARDATNRDEFFDAVEALVGTHPELLSGDEEGRLSFRGATGELDPGSGPFLVVDIGGGSTEFIVGTDRVEGVMSVDVGCVRLTEKFLLHDPPQPEELTACISLTDAYLDDVVREIPAVSEARTLATESRAERIHNPGLEEARADVIVAGGCVLVAIFRHFGFDEMIVSEADILDGLALSLLDQPGS